MSLKNVALSSLLSFTNVVVCLVELIQIQVLTLLLLHNGYLVVALFYSHYNPLSNPPPPPHLFISVCQILDQEKREHLSLKSTWTMANDQFLESNRLLMADIKRTKSILSPDQQKKLHGE